MANSARVVCWQNREEWTRIYRNLYSFDNADLQRKGIARVLAWKSRSGGKLPLSVESTSNLVSAFLTDQSSNCFSYQIQLTISMALVRFVNGITDMNQKGVYARSVQSIAEEIGLPDWLVDLRHEATHAALPSRQTLRAGIRVALGWLEEEYWTAQIRMHKDAEEKLPHLLAKYRESAVSCLGKKKGKKTGKACSSLVQEITSLVSANNLWSDIQSLLSSEILTSTDDITGLSESEPQIGEMEKSSLPTELVTIWKPLLVALDQESSDFIPTFLISTFNLLSDSPGQKLDRKRFICIGEWAKWVINQCSSEHPIFNCEIPWYALLEISLLKPSTFSRPLVGPILKQLPSVPELLKQQIIKCVDIYFGVSSIGDSSDQGIDNQFLQEIFKKKRNKDFSKLNTNQHQQSIGWTQCLNTTRWHLIPFGEVLGTNNQSCDSLELLVFGEMHKQCRDRQGEENSRDDFPITTYTQVQEDYLEDDVSSPIEELGCEVSDENIDEENMEVDNLDLEEFQRQIVLF